MSVKIEEWRVESEDVESLRARLHLNHFPKENTSILTLHSQLSTLKTNPTLPHYEYSSDKSTVSAVTAEISKAVRSSLPVSSCLM